MDVKTHWKKLINPNYIGAYELMGVTDELTVTITDVKKEKVKNADGKEKESIVAYLKGQKPMVLNSTNCKTISKIYGTPLIQDWIGKSITLYVAKIKAFGEDNVECLRIRPTKPTTKLPELIPSDTENWDKVKSALKNGYTIDKIKTRWSISKENQEKLITEAI